MVFRLIVTVDYGSVNNDYAEGRKIGHDQPKWPFTIVRN